MSMQARLLELIRAHEGPLTRELARRPGRFGLGQVPERLAPDSASTTVCGFCSTGCGLLAHLRGGEAINLSPDPAYPVNRGMACPKGWEALAVLDSADRATTPLIRDAKTRDLRSATWGEAMDLFVGRFRQVQQRYGSDSAAFLGTGQIPTEELVFFGTLAKFAMGMVDGDGNTRQCMATAARAYKESFGYDAPPFTYADLEQSDVIVLIGSNLCVAHPILWERICRNAHRPEIIVIDPRRTETAMAATLHLPLRPKSDLPLFYGLAKLLVDRGWVDPEYIERHTEGYAGFVAFLAGFSLERVTRETGLQATALIDLAERIHRGERVSFWWTMGVNQSHEGVRLAQAIIDVALMTGQMGRPGTGANSITGQCNAMGSRLFSNTSSLLGGRDFTNPVHRAEVAAILDISPTAIPERASLAYDEILDEVRGGRIKALWIVATNTMHSWIDQNALGEIRDELDFLVVQDMYHSTETARIADLVLPAAGWGEKDGTFINSERRIGRVRKVRRAPGQALADFQIFRLIANAWGTGRVFERWKTPEDVFDTMKALSRGTPCDFSGIRSYRMLDDEGGVQWPLPEEAMGSELETERRLFEKGDFFREEGRALFVYESPRPVAEPTDREFPFVLMTGRGSSAQWHTQTRTGKSAVLRKLTSDPTRVQMHPNDASARGLREDDEVEIRSRRGFLRARLRTTSTVAEGTLFVSMHDPAVNRLTFASFDPYSRQPSYKHCAVEVAKGVGIDDDTRIEENVSWPRRSARRSSYEES